MLPIGNTPEKIFIPHKETAAIFIPCRMEVAAVFCFLYADLEPTEKRDLMRTIIERIDLYPEQREDGCWVRNIVFNFPVPVSGVLLKELPLKNATMLETVCLLSRSK